MQVIRVAASRRLRSFGFWVLSFELVLVLRRFLQRITYPNGSYTEFEYNSFGQVKKVINIAADSSSHVLNYSSTNLDTPGTNLSDVPRFTETRSWTENFNLDSNGNEQESVVTNTFVPNQTIPSSPDIA